MQPIFRLIANGRDIPALINDRLLTLRIDDSAGGRVDIHNRRPVVLTPELAREWLDPATPKERAEQMVLRQGEPAEASEWFKVNTAVGSVRNQGRNLLVPVLEDR